MASYTFEVKDICCKYAGIPLSESGYYNSSEIIERGAGGIFDFTYPIFDENHRSELERKILAHYYSREIGFETVALWKFKLASKMNEIMPYYNQLYESEKLIKDPLVSTDYVRTTDREYEDTGHTTGHETTKGDSSTTSNNKASSNGTTFDLFSDTPQGGLNGVNNEEYLTDARKIIKNDNDSSDAYASMVENGQRDNTVNDNRNGNSNDTVRMKGNFGTMTKSKMLKEYRDTFLNIDMRIISELEDLFLMLW